MGFVVGLYNEVLGRTPSDAEALSWVTLLNGGVSRFVVSVSFLTSMEYYTDLVQQDYELYLGRAADAGGLATWVTALLNGATDQGVLAQILGSPEGYAKWS